MVKHTQTIGPFCRVGAWVKMCYRESFLKKNSICYFVILAYCNFDLNITWPIHVKYKHFSRIQFNFFDISRKL